MGNKEGSDDTSSTNFSCNQLKFVIKGKPNKTATCVLIRFNQLWQPLNSITNIVSRTRTLAG